MEKKSIFLNVFVFPMESIFTPYVYRIWSSLYTHHFNIGLDTHSAHFYCALFSFNIGFSNFSEYSNPFAFTQLLECLFLDWTNNSLHNESLAYCTIS